VGASLAALAADEPFIMWDWIFDRTDLIWQRTVEHLVLTGIAVGVGTVLSMVLALIAIRWRFTYAPITWVTSALYAIPSIALFALLIPITGFTRLTAEIALVSYTLLVITQNIVAGVDAVPAGVREAADAMGFSPWRRLVRVELPLASPVIIAGVRIATVTVVGLVTITSLIGQGGYGAFINDGLRRAFSTPLVLGMALSVVMATVLDVLLLALQRAITPWTRRRRAHGPDELGALSGLTPDEAALAEAAAVERAS
jgi:osmoprotectant transport system permease protein